MLSVARQFGLEAIPDSLAYYRTHRSQSHRGVMSQASSLQRMQPLLEESLGATVIRRYESNIAAHAGFKLLLRGQPRAARHRGASLPVDDVSEVTSD